MIDFKKWKRTTGSPTRLLLDPLNPRLPEADHTLSQRELIESLVANDDVEDLAKSIVEKGYYPLEPLIAIEQDGKRSVIEGNRRLAALKLLISPDGAPDKEVKKFRRLSEQFDTDTIKKIEILTAPSRAAAAPLIMGKHTKPEVQMWRPIMKAKFYSRLLDTGQTIDEIAREDGTTPSEVARFLQSYGMYQVACTLDLPEDVTKIVSNPRAFPMSTLDRIYRSTPGQKFLGVQFEADGSMKGKVNPDEFRKGFAKLVQDVAVGGEDGIDSRKTNNNEAIEAYLDGIPSTHRPNRRRRGSFTTDSLLAQAAKQTKRPAKAPAKPKRKPVRRPVGIIPRTVQCELNSRRIKDVFTEVKKLRVETFRNSTAIMFRALLEMCVSYYLDETGKINELLARHRKKGKKPADWYPTLRQMLNYVLHDDPDISLSPLTLKALRKHVTDNESFFSIDSLDSFVHNRRFNPSEEHLRGLWDQFEELFLLLLKEPEQPEEE